MLKEYSEFCYYQDQLHAHNLFEAITNSDVNEKIYDDLYEIWNCNRTIDYIALNTSGTTTGIQRQYDFGPLSGFWFTNLEKFIKYRGSSKQVLLTNMLRLFDRRTVLTYLDNNDPHFDAYINTPYLSNQSVNEICACLTELFDFNPDISISADPNVWLYLTSDDEFIDYLKNNKLKLSSTNWESFYKKRPIANFNHVNDNMINWYNGTNFYTCSFGNRHAIPMFIVKGGLTINILNLSGHAACSDDLFIISNDLCDCGKRIMSFVPHIKTQPKINGLLLYNLEFVEVLESKYQHIQFIEDGGVIKVCYGGDMCDDDRRKIESFVGTCVEFVPNSMLKISSKLPTFYTNNFKLSYSTYEPPFRNLL